jgi:peptide/nickel transport system ATP-binding protein
MTGAVALRADGVRVDAAADPRQEVVSDVTFELPPGGSVGIAGESGCGKTALIQALFGYARTGLHPTAGNVRFRGGAADHDLAVSAGDAAFADVRGRVIALVPQAASSVLDPIMPVGRQLEEVAASVAARRNGAARAAVLERLADVGFSDPARVLGRYPHQLSGGQRQRIALSMALLATPDVLVLDEATTDLDVVTQRRILDLIAALRRRYEFGLIAVSHDLRVLAELCDHLLVMYRGRVLESGPTRRLLAAPRHPYSATLVARFEQGPLAASLRRDEVGEPGADGCRFRAHCPLAVERCSQEPGLIELDADHAARCWRHDIVRLPEPAPAARGRRSETAATQPLLRVEGVCASHREPGLVSRRVVRVLHEIDLALHAGESLGIVGESGSGKTTLARILVGLHPIDLGVATFAGSSLALPAVKRSLDLRRDLQIVFQNPEMAFNPRLRIGAVLGRRLKLFEDRTGSGASARIEQLLEDVGLPAAYADKLPSELSGGERQRAAIARALIGDPRLIVCDEVASALDVESQARVVHVLRRLQDEQGIAYLFISHDMAVVAALADRLAVFKDGAVVEVGRTLDVLERSQHPYTRELAAAAFVDDEAAAAGPGGKR